MKQPKVILWTEGDLAGYYVREVWLSTLSLKKLRKRFLKASGKSEPEQGRLGEVDFYTSNTAWANWFVAFRDFVREEGFVTITRSKEVHSLVGIVDAAFKRLEV